MNTKRLLLGIFLLLSFFVVLAIIFMPVFGNGKNGLEFADDFFNSLAKGSSNYMDEMRELSKGFVNVPLAAEINMDSHEKAQKTAALYKEAEAEVAVSGAVVKIKGDLGRILLKSIDDAEAMFLNQGGKLQAQYHYGAKEVLRNWWLSLIKLEKALKKQKKFKEAKATAAVRERAVEPGYNFFGITPASVGERVGLLTLMLVLYVIYTLWFGYGIYELFNGLGLGMEKPVAKKEV